MPWWSVIAIQTLPSSAHFYVPHWVLNHGISWSPKRPFCCLISEKRPPKLQNFGTLEGLLVCPLNHLTLFPSQYSHVFLNKINIWLIHTVGAAVSSGQKHHYQNTSEWGAFTRCSVCTSLIRRDLDFVTVIEFKLHILNTTSNIDLKPQSQSLYFHYLLIQISSLQITPRYPRTVPGTCPLEIFCPKDHLIMK